jgi:diguanylate cyclase (GGDEF)-like protein
MTGPQDRMLDAIAAVANAANEAASAEAAFRVALKEILGATGWRAGHVFVVTPTGAREDIATWEPLDDPDLDALAAGRAASVDAAVVHTVPIVAGAETVAELEFLADRVDPVPADVEASLRTLGVVLGRVVERAQAADALQRARNELGSRPSGPVSTGGDEIRDPETGLFSARFLEEALLIETSRAGRARAQVAVIGLAIDGLDRAGAEARVRAAGHFLLQNVRKGDIPARVGNDFVVVLAGIGSGMGRARAQQLLKGLGNATVPGADEPLSLSAGLASFPQNGARPDTLIEAALEAAREAASKGAGAIQMAKPSTERWSEPSGQAARTARSRP